MISRFSLQAYWDLRDSGQLTKRQTEVFDAIAEHGPMTREEIAKATGMKEGSADGRVNEMVKKGVLVEVSSKINPVTGKLNGIVTLALAERAAYTHPIKTDSADLAQGQLDMRQAERAA